MTESFASYLSRLDEAALTGLLTVRPDVRIEPAPHGFAQLAQRLSGPDSLGAAIRGLHRDALAVGQAIAFLGEAATVPTVARLLDSPERAVRDEVAHLCGVGLAWTESDTLRLPELLLEHWTAELGGGRPVAKMATTVLVDELRQAASALGVAVDGLRKPDLVAGLAEAMADPRRIAKVIGDLPAPARVRLEELRLGRFGIMFGFVDRRTTNPDEVLARAGLLLRPNRQPEVPREVAVAAWLAQNPTGLTGPPEIATAGTTAEAVRPTAQAAAREAVRGTATLLDEAGRTPIAALKKGGVGARERSRLAKRLSTGDDLLTLWIDVSYAAGLLGEVEGGYAPTDAYPAWRAAEPGRQWAVLARAWHELEHAPLMREIDDDKELPPPLPLMSMAGEMRRATLRAAHDGLSVRGAGAEIDWFFPLHGYERQARDEKTVAAVREAELLGVVAGDRVTELGAHLLACDDADDLARRCAVLLPEADCAVILQSDLTAVVSGQPSAAVARLLAATAVTETRGQATIWRFSPASIRAALDAGWTAPELLDELDALTDRPVPQPLDYLINDAARKHGHVRVRRTRSCVVAEEALATEILNTRSLAKLKLARVAPTVLTSPAEPDRVLELLRAAGLSPTAEDEAGTVVVENRHEHRAESEPAVETRPRPRLTPAELVARLVADPGGARAVGGATFDRLARLNPMLDDAELTLLSHAVDNRDDVVIGYRDNNGSHSVRRIRPGRFYDRWLTAFCHLRGADREFTVANIEAVAPAP
ncbi:helicase-associated domain-containing protein [Actinophytocola sp.]|uniref:helicase-associated domain-containing protein n=1 Tax=Actinophytocola sp. TaxID=1872138 RepID=UPI002D2E8661|nr:helicase-associated domain-containing protein [Actinophytocola sp.]HYQ67138.1 helicase-associated domain-containing protein [Actinophytocola sp.]